MVIIYALIIVSIATYHLTCHFFFGVSHDKKIIIDDRFLKYVSEYNKDYKKEDEFQKR